jgi:hypothetical protein
MTGTVHGVAIPAIPATGQGAGAFLSPSAGLPKARNPLCKWMFIVSFSLVKGNRQLEAERRVRSAVPSPARSISGFGGSQAMVV